MASVAFLPSQCWPSLQLGITISTCNPRVCRLSAGNFEHVTSFCKGFRSHGIWYFLVTSQKKGRPQFYRIEDPKTLKVFPSFKNYVLLRLWIHISLSISSQVQGVSNMTGTDLYVNKPHCAESEATISTLPPARVRTCSVLSGSC